MSDTVNDYRLLATIRRSAEENFNTPEPNYRISHKGLVERALANPPKENDRRAEVSAFADWVFDLDNYPHGRSRNILWSMRHEENYRQRALFELGRNSEPAMIEELIRKLKVQDAELRANRRVAQKRYMTRIAANSYSKVGWNLLYDGTSTSDMEVKSIDSLLIGTKPLRARPDLVLKDGKSGDLLIIELKTWQGGSTRPTFEWPNVKAQLWCYGLIEWPESSANVYLQAYVWLTWNDELTKNHFAFAPWRSDDPRRHRESLELFEAFGGRYAPGNLSEAQ